MNRVTLDTNIDVSAFEFGGDPMRLRQMGIDGGIEIAVSQPIIDETIRVLPENFKWPDSDLRDASVAAPAQVIQCKAHNPSAVSPAPVSRDIASGAASPGSDDQISSIPQSPPTYVRATQRTRKPWPKAGLDRRACCHGLAECFILV